MAPTYETWLRKNNAQLWAQAYNDMMQLRSSYLESMKNDGVSEEYPKYLELPKDLWEESKKRSDAAIDRCASSVGGLGPGDSCSRFCCVASFWSAKERGLFMFT